MKVFDIYSLYYDLLYKDKDYAAETSYIHKLIQSNVPTGSSLLDLGCGTGKHDFEFAQLGYKVTGVDLSDQMIAVAASKLSVDYKTNADSLDFVSGDIRSIRLNKKFDAVVSLFHVMCYQTSNADLKQAFKTAANHLSTGGIFVFDFWYGPGVLHDLPTVRVKRLENEKIAVTRITEPQVHVNENIVDVHFEVQIKDKIADTNNLEVIHELHQMRYLFLPELLLFMEEEGFEFVAIKEWLGEAPPTIKSWYSVLICRKKSK